MFIMNNYFWNQIWYHDINERKNCNLDVYDIYWYYSSHLSRFEMEDIKMSSVIANFNSEIAVMGCDSRILKVTKDGIITSNDAEKIIELPNTLIGIVGRNDFLWNGKEMFLKDIFRQELHDFTAEGLERDIKSILQKIASQLDGTAAKPDMVDIICCVAENNKIICLSGDLVQNGDSPVVYMRRQDENIGHVVVGGVQHCTKNPIIHDLMYNPNVSKERVLKAINIDKSQEEHNKGERACVGGEIKLYTLMKDGTIKKEG